MRVCGGIIHIRSKEARRLCFFFFFFFLTGRKLLNSDFKPSRGRALIEQRAARSETSSASFLQPKPERLGASLPRADGISPRKMWALCPSVPHSQGHKMSASRENGIEFISFFHAEACPTKQDTSLPPPLIPP